MRGAASMVFSVADAHRILLLWIGQQTRRPVVQKLGRVTTYERGLNTGIHFTGHQSVPPELVGLREGFSSLKRRRPAGTDWSCGGWTHAWGGQFQTWGCDKFCATVKPFACRELNVGVSTEASVKIENQPGAPAAINSDGIDTKDRGLPGGLEQTAGEEDFGSSGGSRQNQSKTNAANAATDVASSSSEPAETASSIESKKGKAGKRHNRKMGNAVVRLYNWRDIDRYLVQNRALLTAEDVRTMWKRAVYTHVDMEKRKLRDSAPHATPRGRAFLWDLARETLARKGGLSSQQLRDIGWASGKLWFADRELTEMVKHDLVMALEDSQVPVFQIVPVVWALAQSGNYPDELFDVMVRMGDNTMGSFNIQNCTNLVWAMAFSGYHPGSAFLEELCDIVVTRFSEGKQKVIPQTVADLLWSIGRLGHSSPAKIVHSCMQWAHKNLVSFGAAELVATSQGLAMLGSLGAEHFHKFVGQFATLSRASSVPPVAMDRMTSLTLLFNRSERERFQDLLFGVSKDQLRREREQWQAQVARRIRDNVFIVGISKVLDDLSIYHQVGTVLASGQLAVELLLEKEGKMYGVVPVHKMSMNRNGGRTVLGEVKLAGQLLEAQDLPVIGHILMSEWEACGDDADARKQLIQKRIKVGGPA